ncbi:MAG: phosphoribosyltransferase [Flavobacteriaceae bacterium CG_4_9_14_0_8_um_filter_34_30]|nr:phosphoribosyltransferase [Flavobacteriia bacterium]PJC07471.1 MAG: phosphoribosyltransferase [Flavobacteriaceae bacterium CG_4_9_14_0_8_um_filter_34_30]
MLLPEDQILDNTQIEHIIRRIAYQIYESNPNESEILLAGIKENGYILAKKLKKQLEKISPLKAILCEVIMDKKNPLNIISTSVSIHDYKHCSIVLVDDVLSSGSTLIHAVKHFLQIPLKQLKTVVLIDRNHKKYPIKADFKGISLSTSLNENVAVIFEKNKDRAILE